MSNIFKEIKYFFLAMREKNLQKKLQKTTKRSFTNKTTKKIFGTAANITLNSETEKKIQLVKTNVSAIVKKTNCNPEELLNYIKAANTPVYKLDYADKFLSFIKEEEGLIYEKEGFEAIYLSVITGQGIKLKTSPMFILREGTIDKYYMLHHFHRWYSLKSDLPGFEYQIQRKFKQFLLAEDVDKFVKTFNLEDIISLKEAIARDQEATEFVLNYTKEIDGSKNVIEKIKNDGGANI